MRAALFALVLAAGLAPAAEPTPREQAVKFFKDHIVGKTYQSDTAVLKLVKQNVEVVFSSTFRVTECKESATGFSWKVTIGNKETVYSLDKDGRRDGEGKTTATKGESETVMTERKSTGELVGFDRMLSSSDKAGVLEDQATVCRLMMTADGMELVNLTPLYLDREIAPGKFQPSSMKSTLKMVLKDGRTSGEWTNHLSNVDPATMKRSPSDLPTLRLKFATSR